MIRVLIADDQALMRSGLRMILDGQPDMEVVGEAENGHDALAQAREKQPDVVLMDIRMPKLDGLEATRRLRQAGAPPPRIVILTTFDLDDYVYDALRSGATGFLLKSAPPQQLADGIRAAHGGDALLAPEITRRLIERFVRRPPPGDATPPELVDLTPRELEVLALIAQGLTNAEIAERLVLSDTTIKTHVNHILTKLRLRDRVQAVILAYRSGLADTWGETKLPSE
jgi:DNA-binding NarL/FixJ family response regulator